MHGAPSVTNDRALLGIVYVDVDVAATGRVSWVHLAKSSGNDLIDESALKAAYASTYKAASLRCSPSPGNITLIFRYQ